MGCKLLCHFSILTMFNTIFGAGAVGAGAVLRYYGFDHMMRLFAAPALQN
jgi:hypothetical protein